MPKKMLTVSIILPTYNRSRLLDYTLHNISDQECEGCQIQVIVADDGSADDTKSIVEKYIGRLDIEYYYQEDKGYRLSSARNLGIRHAKGDVVLFMDPGILIGRSLVKEHVKIHRSSRTPVAVIGYVYGIDQQNKYRDYLTDLIDVDDPETAFKALHDDRLLLDIREECYGLCEDNIGMLPAPWALFWGNNVSVARRIVDKVGSFDVNFDYNWGIEDIEFGYRLHKHKVEFKLNRAAKAIHYPHDNDWAAKEKQEYVNKHYFNQKYKSIETELLLESDTVGLNIDLLQTHRI